jgi:hypothetical protein
MRLGHVTGRGPVCYRKVLRVAFLKLKNRLHHVSENGHTHAANLEQVLARDMPDLLRIPRRRIYACFTWSTFWVSLEFVCSSAVNRIDTEFRPMPSIIIFEREMVMLMLCRADSPHFKYRNTFGLPGWHGATIQCRGRKEDDKAYSTDDLSTFDVDDSVNDDEPSGTVEPGTSSTYFMEAISLVAEGNWWTRLCLFGRDMPLTWISSQSTSSILRTSPKVPCIFIRQVLG